MNHLAQSRTEAKLQLLPMYYLRVSGMDLIALASKMQGNFPQNQRELR